MYINRIIHICNEVIYELMSATTVVQFNRLIRIFLVSEIYSSIKGLSYLWKDYIKTLISQLSINQLIYVDCKDKQLHLTNGLTGICLLMEKINKNFINTKFNIPWDYYCTKIHNSSLKEHLAKENLPIYDLGINGFWGISYCLDTRCKDKKQYL